MAELHSPHHPDNGTETPRMVPVHRLSKETFNELMRLRTDSRAKPGLDFLQGDTNEVKSFAELQQSDTPNPQDVIDTLRDYAESGAAISDHVVIEVIAKANLSRKQLSDCLNHAQQGYNVHANMAQHSIEAEAEQHEADNFTVVTDYIRQLLSEV